MDRKELKQALDEIADAYPRLTSSQKEFVDGVINKLKTDMLTIMFMNLKR